MRKLGELGCSGPEARDRLKRIMVTMGLGNVAKDLTIPLTIKERTFIHEMVEALALNPNFEPSYGMVTYATDLYEKYCV